MVFPLYGATFVFVNCWIEYNYYHTRHFYVVFLSLVKAYVASKKLREYIYLRKYYTWNFPGWNLFACGFLNCILSIETQVFSLF